MGRKSGGFEGLLIVAAAIVGLIVTIVQKIWPILLALVIIGVVFYLLRVLYLKKQKANELKREKLANYANHLQMLEKYYNDAKLSLQTNPIQPFTQSLVDQLSYEIEITNANIQMVEGSISEEEAQIKIEAAQNAINKYNLVIEKEKNKDRTTNFEELNKLLSSQKMIRWINKIPNNHKIYAWANDFNSTNTKFTKKYYNKVELSDSQEVYAITCKNITYYFYIDCIVESRSKYEFKVFNYKDVTFTKSSASVEESGKGIPGAKLMGTTYKYTRIDGGPDLRYNYNPQYNIYLYYYVYSKQLSNFILEIGDGAFADALYKSLLKLVNYTQSDKDEEIINEEKDNQKVIDNDGKDLEDEKTLKSYNDDQIIETIRSIFMNYGNDIILDKRFIYMLDDYKVFNEIPYFKNILKLLQGERAMNEIIEQDSWNNKCKSLVSSISQKYMLQDDAVERVMRDIVLAINK